jgi:cysteine desulfurase
MIHDILYLDNNASTRPLPEVVASVVAVMESSWGNPASGHNAGRSALEHTERARESVADLIGAPATHVAFTSGATEANNLALRGLWEGSRDREPERTQVVVGATEHPAVLQVANWLAKHGAEIVTLPVDRSGLIDLNVLCAAVSGRDFATQEHSRAVRRRWTYATDVISRHRCFKDVLDRELKICL